MHVELAVEIIDKHAKMMFSMTTSVQHRNGVHTVMIVHSTGYYVQ